jgi:hypothetical protein
LTAFTSQVSLTGDEIKFVPAYANTTTTPTLSLNGNGAQTITKCGQAPLAAGDYTPTDVADVINDGTYWELQNPISGCGSGGTVYVNSTPITSPHFNNSVPAPDSGYVAVEWKTSGSNVLGEVPAGTTSGVSQILAGTNVNVSPSGGTGVVTISSTGGSSSNLITGANIIFTGDSLMKDDSKDTLGATVTATAVSCTSGGLCTVTAPNSYVANQWVDTEGITSPSLYCGSYGYYGTGNQLYQVLASGLSTSQFEIQTACGAQTGTGGTVEDATYFMPILTSVQPAFSGINAWYLRNGVDVASIYGGYSGLVCEQATNFTAMFSDLLPSSTGKSLFFLEEGGTNDIVRGESESVIEGCFQSFWAQAHTAGVKVVQNTIPQYSANSSATVTDLNEWLILQGKSNANTASGQYWDYSAVDMRAMGSVTNPFPSPQIARVAQAWDASIDSPGTSGFTLTACNLEADCANVNETNTFLTIQNSLGGFAAENAGGADTANLGVNGNSPYLGFTIGYAFWPFIVGQNDSVGKIDGVIPGTDSLCWNTATGGGSGQYGAGVVGFSIDTGNSLIDVGNCTTNNYSTGLKLTNLYFATLLSQSCLGTDSTGKVVAGTCSGGGTILHTTIAVGTTSVPANSCLPTGTTYSTATMTGVTTAMTFHFGWSADYSAVSGWTPGTPGLYFTSYPTANTLNYQVCNATGTAIVPGSSTTWNVTAQ